MRTIRLGTFETNSSSTHSLVIMSKDEYKSFKDGNMVLDLYNGIAKPLDENKKIEETDDGSIIYNGTTYGDKYDFYEEEYDDFDDEYATQDYLDMYADVKTKELGDNVIMSVYRGERW